MTLAQNPSEQVYIDRLMELAASWGGSIETDNSLTWFFAHDLCVSPFSSAVGIIWEERAILFDPERLPHPVTALIHEMGHVFASKKPPKKADEMEFFGWEVKLAELIGYPMESWLAGNADYCLTPDGWTIGEVVRNRREGYSPLNEPEETPDMWKIVDECVRVGTKIGIFVDGVPCPIR